MNTPVTFELAKLLKEKGFDEGCLYFFTEYKELYCLHPEESYTGFTPKNDFDLELNIKYPFEYNNVKAICQAPTIAEVVMWLYEKHGIWISVYQYKDHAADNNDPFSFRSNATGSKEFNNPTEAYEAAIEYTLNNLI